MIMGGDASRDGDGEEGEDGIRGDDDDDVCAILRLTLECF